MKDIFALIVSVAVAYLATVPYLVSYILYHQTEVTEHEIVIGRVTGFGTSITYAVDKRTGDEKLISRRYIPLFISSQYLSIDYSGSCRCVVSVFQNDANGTYYVSQAAYVFHTADKAYVMTGGVFNKSEYVPYEQVRDRFDRAQATLDEVRSSYASVVAR
ncbi:MAG: hypothetical protein AAB449_01410 [Patescibacteria group bacterium]